MARHDGEEVGVPGGPDRVRREGDGAEFAAIQRQSGARGDGERPHQVGLHHGGSAERVHAGDPPLLIGRQRVEDLLRDGQARILNRPVVVLELPRPRGAVVGHGHRVVVVEGEDDLAVVRRHVQEFVLRDAVPAVRAQHQAALRLQRADGAVGEVQDAVPVGRVVGDGFVEQFVGHAVARTVAEAFRNLAPAVGEGLGGRRLGEQRLGAFVEMMRAQDVQVDHRVQPGFERPVQTLLEQIPCLLVRSALVVPELLLVDGEAQVVEAERGEPRDVLTGESPAPFVAARVALTEPVGDVGAASECESHECLMLV